MSYRIRGTIDPPTSTQPKYDVDLTVESDTDLLRSELQRWAPRLLQVLRICDDAGHSEGRDGGTAAVRLKRQSALADWHSAEFIAAMRGILKPLLFSADLDPFDAPRTGQ